MPTLTELSSDFRNVERPVGVIISDDNIRGLLIAAVRFYAGYAPLQSTLEAAGVVMKAEDACKQNENDAAYVNTLTTLTEITDDTELTAGEWALIRPLFLLFVERETALQLEASRTFGVDPYGRSVSEISQEITQYEHEMAEKAFCMPFVTM